MMPSALQPRPWPRRRWWIVVLFVFVVQVGLIFGLSDRRPVHRRHRGLAPSFELVGSTASGWLALTDPTLFALPHQQGFAGMAWLPAWQPAFTNFDCPEEPEFLVLAVDRLGTQPEAPVPDADLSSPGGVARPEPAMMLGETGPPAASSVRSGVRLEDGLVGRRLLGSNELAPMPHSDLLANTVVQVVVGADGRPVSVPILLSSSGSRAADEKALNLARTARFNALELTSGRPNDPMAQLVWGRMIFQWQTLPMPATNSATSDP